MLKKNSFLFGLIKKTSHICGGLQIVIRYR